MIEVVYPHIQGWMDFYRQYSQRFAATFDRFRPRLSHQLTVVCCDERAAIYPDSRGLFGPLTSKVILYTGPGMDIGAHQFAAQNSTSDWMVFCSSLVHFYREGWLERMAEAMESWPDGLLGAMGSYEETRHLRTCFYACRREDMNSFPLRVNSREESFEFEHGEKSFTRHFLDCRRPAVMVCWSGFYLPDEWRSPPNIFRRGDQSDVIVRDKHTDVYEQSNAGDKRLLESITDGKGWPA